MRLKKSEAEPDLGRAALLDGATPIYLQESSQEKPLLPAALTETPVQNELSAQSPLEPEMKERLVVEPTETKRQHLINIIANPNTKETEWIKACEILRDWNPIFSSKK